MIKNFLEYKFEKACGWKFLDRYFLKKGNWAGSDAMALGHWFEYAATGALPKEGHIPKPDTTSRGELTAPYKRMQAQLPNFHKWMAHHKMKVIDVGTRIITEDEEEGTMDLWCEWLGINQNYKDPKSVIVDIKTTGLFHKSYGDMDWGDPYLETRHKIMIQSSFYPYLFHKKYREIPDFIFLVFNTANEYDYKARMVNIDPEEDFPFIEMTNKKLREEIELELDMGFTPYASYDNCKDCVLKETCPKYIDVQDIKIIDYSVAL